MTPDIESQEEVLGEILTRAASNHLAKKVIGAYVPGKSYNINYQNIKSFDAAHQEAAASFFGFTVRGESDKKLYKNLKILSDRILLKIESFFEILCNDCEETYRNTLDCAPVFTCRICMQGSHTCAKVTQRAAAYEAVPEDMRMTGMSWLCSECHRKNDLTITPKNDVTSTSQKPGEVEKVDADKKEVKEDVKSIPPPKPKEEDICKDYLKKRCAHGISGKKLVEGNPCPKAHPHPVDATSTTGPMRNVAADSRRMTARMSTSISVVGLSRTGYVRKSRRHALSSTYRRPGLNHVRKTHRWNTPSANLVSKAPPPGTDHAGIALLDVGIKRLALRHLIPDQPLLF